MNADDIRRIFPNASRSLLAANAPSSELSGEGSTNEASANAAVRDQLEQRPAAGAPRKARAKTEDTKRFLVRVTSIRSRLIDEDNLCEKYIVDCCRYAGLLPGDGPGQTRIEVAQRKAGKEEAEHTVIEIFTLE
jgi:hypothetical protein